MSSLQHLFFPAIFHQGCPTASPTGSINKTGTHSFTQPQSNLLILEFGGRRVTQFQDKCGQEEVKAGCNQGSPGPLLSARLFIITLSLQKRCQRFHNSRMWLSSGGCPEICWKQKELDVNLRLLTRGGDAAPRHVVREACSGWEWKFFLKLVAYIKMLCILIIVFL